MKTTVQPIKEKSLIKNATIEEMFLRIANDQEMAAYINEIRSGATHRATAYASRKIKPIFFFLADYYTRQGGNIEFLKDQVYRKRR